MNGQRLLGLGTLLLFLLLGAAAWTADPGKETSSVPGFAASSPGADLFALTESVARRARELDLSDLRVQEERRLLEKLKEELRKDLSTLDQKLSTLEQHSQERSAARKAARQYVAKVFRSMDSEDSAKRLQLMGEREAATLMREMKEKDVARIMSKMEAPFSVAITRLMEKM